MADRFTHLLQPIRDLAVNWDVDIASALEEYLEDLEGITVTLGEELRSAVNDGDEIETINFAEAALLIQGSALIYSKKVEYLYQLVHHTLDIVTNHKSKGAQKVSASALAEDEAAFREATSSFLLLDDHIKEGKDIDIVDMDYDPSLHGYDTRGASLASKNINSSNNPMLALLLKEKRGSTFRMNSCEVHPSGALMIGSAQTGGQISDTLEKLISPSSVYFSPNTSRNSSNVVHLEANNNNHDDDSIDGHDDYFGPDDDGYDDNMQNENDNQFNEANTNESSLFGPSSTVSKVSKNTSVKNTKPVNGASNPWLLLDPHDCSKQQIRPLRPGKTFKVPSLIDPRHEGITTQSHQETHVKQSIEVVMIEGGSKKKATKSENKIKFQGLANQEFSYVLKIERSRKMAAKRLEKTQSSSQYYRREEEEDDDDFGDDNHANDYGGGVDFGVYGDGGDDNDDEDEDNAGGFLPNPNAMMSQFDEAEGITHDHHSGYGGGSEVNHLDLDNAFDQAPKTYADLCRDHIAKYMQGVDRYAHESQLSLRVGEWQERLGPMLKEQESRRPFDIHEYGREIIKKCIDVTAQNKAQESKLKGAKSSHRDMPIDFSAMTSSQPKFEICRLFLASLQLSNNLNIKLHHAEGGVCGPDDLKLEVLNMHVGEDRFS